MALSKHDNEIKFFVTVNSLDAVRGFDEAADAAERSAHRIRTAFDKDLYQNHAAQVRQLKTQFNDLPSALHSSEKAFDGVARSSREANNGLGEVIESLGEGDLGEIFGLIAQRGGAMGIAFVGVAAASLGAAIGIGALTKAIVTNVAEVDKLSKETKRSTLEIQAAQVAAQLTGESVEDLAKNYGKLRPQMAQFENLVKTNGAEIDKELRQQAQRAGLAFEDMKLAAVGAMNAIGREALPEVAALLRDMAKTIRDLRPAWQAAGEGAAWFANKVREAVEGAKDDIEVLRQIIRLVQFDQEGLQKGFREGGIKFAGKQNSVEEARKYLKEQYSSLFGGGFTNQEIDDLTKFGPEHKFVPKKPGDGGFNIPSLSGGGGASREKDITLLQREIELMRQGQAEIKGRIALMSSQKDKAEELTRANSDLYQVTMRLHQLEKQQAQTLPPNKQFVELARIQDQEADALRQYANELEEITSGPLKEMAELSERINKQNAENADAVEKQERAYRRLFSTLRALELDRRATELENQREQTDLEARSGSLSSKALIRERAEQDIAEANIRLDRKKEQRDRLLETIEDEIEDERMRLAVQADINRAFEEETVRHTYEVDAIKRAAREAEERENPLSTRSIFGDRFADAFVGVETKMQAFRSLVAGVSSDVTKSLRNLGEIGADAFGSFAGGIGAAVKQFVLLGTTGPAVLRKLLAETLATIAQEAAVNSIKMLAVGFANLAVQRYDAATQAFTSAAIWGSIAGVAGLAGRAIAPAASSSAGGGNSGNSNANSGPVIINQDTSSRQANVIIVRADPGITVEHSIANIKNNGELRQALAFAPAT